MNNSYRGTESLPPPMGPMQNPLWSSDLEAQVQALVDEEMIMNDDGSQRRPDLDDATIIDAKFSISDAAIEAYGSELKPKAEWFIRYHFGDRCREYDRYCPLCKAWEAFDVIFGDVP